MKCFAARAQQIFRETDLLCRLGGDEFVIVIPAASLREGLEIAERIRAATASGEFAAAAGGHSIAGTVSAGLAESAGGSSDALLRRADRALYRSKQDGRNRDSVDHARDRSWNGRLAGGAIGKLKWTRAVGSTLRRAGIVITGNCHSRAAAGPLPP